MADVALGQTHNIRILSKDRLLNKPIKQTNGTKTSLIRPAVMTLTSYLKKQLAGLNDEFATVEKRHEKERSINEERKNDHSL